MGYCYQNYFVDKYDWAMMAMAFAYLIFQGEQFGSSSARTVTNCLAAGSSAIIYICLNKSVQNELLRLLPASDAVSTAIEIIPLPPMQSNYALI